MAVWRDNMISILLHQIYLLLSFFNQYWYFSIQQLPNYPEKGLLLFTELAIEQVMLFLLFLYFHFFMISWFFIIIAKKFYTCITNFLSYLISPVQVLTFIIMIHVDIFLSFTNTNCPSISIRLVFNRVEKIIITCSVSSSRTCNVSWCIMNK